MKLDITPRNGWLFTVLSLIPDFVFEKKADGKNQKPETIFETYTAYMGSYAVENGVHVAASKSSGFVKKAAFPHETIVGTHKYILLRTKKLIGGQIDKAHALEKGLIIGFTVWHDQQVLDVLDMLSFTRDFSNDRAVCLVGGPGLHKHAPNLEQKLCAAGADIKNIGGGHEIAEWIGHLSINDRFFRDSNRRLIAPIPENTTFFTDSRKYNGARGKDNAITLLYDTAKRMISARLLGSGCINACDFCASGLYMHERITDEKILHVAERVNHVIPKMHVIPKIIRGSKEETTAPITLEICNLNPMQNMRALNDFVSLVDKEGLEITHFGDALSFRTKENMENHFNYINNLLTENSSVSLYIALSMDAIQAKNDGDFLGRRIAGRLVREKEYKDILENYYFFLDKLSGQPWLDRLFLRMNFIAHPAMTAEIYENKYALFDDMAAILTIDRCSFMSSTLIPHEGTPLADNYKGHYAPYVYMEKDWELGHVFSSTYMSIWGNQFEQGDLLDCFALCKIAKMASSSIYPRNLFDMLLSGWNGSAVRYPNYTGEQLDKREKKFITHHAHKILNGDKPRIIGLLDYLLDFADGMPDNTPDRKKIKLASALYSAIHWINRREKYLIRTNPIYVHNRNCRFIVEKTAGMMKSIAPMKPEIDDFDERPQRNYILG